MSIYVTGESIRFQFILPPVLVWTYPASAIIHYPDESTTFHFQGAGLTNWAEIPADFGGPDLDEEGSVVWDQTFSQTGTHNISIVVANSDCSAYDVIGEFKINMRELSANYIKITKAYPFPV
jgi:hypothetical protein